MKDDIKLIIRRISTQIACFIIIDLLLIGVYIVKPNNSIFSFTIYGSQPFCFTTIAAGPT
jgi:hypothetical protein